VEVRLNNAQYFTEVKIITIISRLLKKHHYANVQICAGQKKSSRKSDCCFRFGCQEDTWSLKKKNAPQVDLLPLAGDVEINPGPSTNPTTCYTDMPRRRMDPVWYFWIPNPIRQAAYPMLLLCTMFWLCAAVIGQPIPRGHMNTEDFSQEHYHRVTRALHSRELLHRVTRALFENKN
jgi:hypothetical protein